jgi:hypothetical protein
MCFFNKRISFILFKTLKNNINDIDQYIVFFIKIAHNCKLGMKNIKIMKII